MFCSFLKVLPNGASTKYYLYSLFAGRDSLHMHRVTVNADRYTPVDNELLPTGKIAHVAGTKFDLRIGRRLESIEAGLRARDIIL